MYLANRWYAAALSAEIGAQPFARKICERDIVLFRTESGRLAALEDRCAHRHAPLSLGAVKGEAIAVFCVLRPGESDSPELRASIAAEVTRALGKALRPGVVAVVPALPKTRSGKVMRRVVRAAYLGLDPGDLSALDDPLTLEAIRALRT